MAKKNVVLDPLIIEAARETFAKCGYKNATVREIAKRAGVTTGAIYTRYKGKEQLFNALVSKTADNFFELYDQMFEEFEKLNKSEKLKCLLAGNESKNDDGISNMINLLYESYDEIKLLMICSGGTEHESFLEKIIDKEVKMIMSYIDDLGGLTNKEREMYKMNVRIIIASHFKGVIEIFKHNLSLEDANLYLNNLEEFYRVGWKYFFEKITEK